MYLRRCYRQKDGKRHGYWALVESYRSLRGPRQRVVAYLGELNAAGRLGIHRHAAGAAAVAQRGLFGAVEPQWVEVDLKRIAVERQRAFGGPWLGLELCRQVGLVDFLEQTLPVGREQIPWAVMAQILILARLCDPSSELQIAERFYEASACSDLLGVPASKVNEDRLYRALDQLLPHKEELERHLKNRLGELFDLDYDLLLYDVTSTYFEGVADPAIAKRGYSRDHRPDCVQVNIALVVSREGMPLGYEIFAGNTTDVTTVKQVVESMEERFGKVNRVWVMDRGMVSGENIAWLNATGHRYVIGTARAELRRWAKQIADKTDLRQIREDIEVKICRGPDGSETFLLCRSASRMEKEKAMHERFSRRIEEGLRSLARRIEKSQTALERGALERQIGRLLERNSRAAARYSISMAEDDSAPAKLRLKWSPRSEWDDWMRAAEGTYILRSNIQDWTDGELWKTYIQLTEAEAAFRIQKSDLCIRPIWHHKQGRIKAHILICFLAYALWKTLQKWQSRAGLGDSPRTILTEFSRIHCADIVLPLADGSGRELRLRCIVRPEREQALLLQRLGLTLPQRLHPPPMAKI